MGATGASLDELNDSKNHSYEVCIISILIWNNFRKKL